MSKSVKNSTEKKTTVEKKEVSKKVDTVKLNARKEFYSDNDTMEMNSTVKMAKNSNLPFLNKKQIWLVNRLLSNDITKGYIYTLDSLSNDYRKTIKDNKEKNAKKSNYVFRKHFKSNEVISIPDVKASIQYIYHSNNRLFEYKRNEKGNYYVKETEFIYNLSTLKANKK